MRLSLSLTVPTVCKISAFVILFSFCLLSPGCKKDRQAVSADKAIISFEFNSLDNAGVIKTTVAGVIKADTVLIGLMEGTVRTSLRPKIVISGKSISPQSLLPTDFTNPVRYIVTAEDGSQKSYVVIARMLSSAKEITGFVFKKSDNPTLPKDIMGILKGDSIIVYMPADVDRTKLRPSITFKGSLLRPEAGYINDFSTNVSYSVVAEDLSMKAYTVIVTTNKMVLFGSTDGSLYAVDPVTGSLIWKFKTFTQLGSPVYADGLVFTGSNRVFYALDAETGKVKWQNDEFSGGIFSPASVYNGIVYANLVDRFGYLIAFDEFTGAVKWKQPYSGNYGFSSGPTAKGGMVYSSDYTRNICAYDAASGALKWKYPSGICGNKPLVNNGILYSGMDGIAMAAINALSGQKIWLSTKSKPESSNITSSATLANGVVYAGCWQSDATCALLAFDANDASLKWKYERDGDGNITYGKFSSPYFYKDVIYVGNDENMLYAIDANTGKEKWVYTDSWTPNRSHPNPVVSDGVVFVNHTNDYFYAVDANSGALLWTFKGSATINSDPCVVDMSGNAYYPGHEGAQ